MKIAGVEVRSSSSTSTSTRNSRPKPSHPHSTLMSLIDTVNSAINDERLRRNRDVTTIQNNIYPFTTQAPERSEASPKMIKWVKGSFLVIVSPRILLILSLILSACVNLCKSGCRILISCNYCINRTSEIICVITHLVTKIYHELI